MVNARNVQDPVELFDLHISHIGINAATDEEVQPDATYRMSGNQIGVRTLDLDRPFEEIRAQLDGIADMLTSPSASAS